MIFVYGCKAIGDLVGLKINELKPCISYLKVRIIKL